jgi:tetratricopeptide (TPR) repeat protein
VVEFFVDNYGLASLKAVLADLAEGKEINAVISNRMAPIEKIEKQFEAFALKRAEDLAEKVDWTEPEAGQFDPSNPEALAEWLEKHPNSFWALNLQVNRLMEDGNWEQAQIILKKLLSLYPNYTGEGNAYSLLAQIYRKLDETEQEWLVLNKLAAVSANAVEAYGRLMEIAMEQEDWGAVLENGNKYIAVYPMLGTVHFQMGRAYEELGQSEQAIESYKRLLLLNPQDPADINYRLADLYKDKNPVVAKRYVLEALADAPRFRKAHRLLLSIIGNFSPDTSGPESTPINPSESLIIQEDIP